MAAVVPAAMLNPINTSLIATALVPISSTLHVSVAATTVPVSSLYLSSAVMQPTAGRLADHLGARCVLLAGLELAAAGGLIGTLRAEPIPAVWH